MKICDVLYFRFYDEYCFITSIENDNIKFKFIKNKDVNNLPCIGNCKLQEIDKFFTITNMNINDNRFKLLYGKYLI